MARPVIELEQARKEFRRGRRSVHVLKGVDLSVDAGEFVAVMGPSGSGKSTMLNIMSCLDTLSGGVYRLDGRDITGVTVKRRARIRNRAFGFVFQNYNLLPRASALENVELPLLYRGVGARRRQGRARAALHDLGLGDRLHHRPSELSGGEQQRVAIARAMVSEPEVLFADEPTGALDSRSGRAIMDILKGLNARGLTIVLVSHDPGVAGYAERIIQLFDGQVQDAPPIGEPTLL